jgi:thioester reductase-like protein
MGKAKGILLTGVTGFLGEHLLRDLSAAGRLLVLLVRDGGQCTADERVQALVQAWKQTPCAEIVVLAGDVRVSNLGLTATDRAWVARKCSCTVHAAASIAFHVSANGDPWATNVDGTARLLDFCTSAGIQEFHHVSTAFVCGDRCGPILESDLECGQGFHNDYERSKFEAERRVRTARSVQATVYRPSVIVGDSRTGKATSFPGFYRFPEVADRLATALGGTQRRVLPLRVPLDGEELRNLVPVDWVAGAIVEVIETPQLHGRTYHLVARQPVPARWIKEAAEEVLRIDGVSFAGRAAIPDPSGLEELFLSRLREYEPYLYSDPEFDCRNTLAALPHLPAPLMDRECLARLIRFARAANWGKTPRRRQLADSSRCAHYIEEFFPQASRRSTLASLPLDVTVRLEIAEAGCWHCRWAAGELASIRRDGEEPAAVTYRMDVATFENVVQGRVSPHDAFLAHDIEIAGDIEKGLKLAVLFGHFV